MKGKWIDDCTCSVCHWIHEDDNGFALITNYNFCPNCGAEMKNRRYKMDHKQRYYIAINKLYRFHTLIHPTHNGAVAFDEDTRAILTVSLYDSYIDVQSFRKLKNYCNKLSERMATETYI